MSSKTDLVIGAVGGYGWEQIEVWALSLVKSGFDGIGAIIVYDKNETVINNLKSLGFQVIEMPLRGTVYNQRFQDFYEVISGSVNDLRYVIVTDVRDVYFQTNPITWLEQNLTKPMLATSEGLLYKDEPWGRDNMTAGFPHLAARMMETTIHNVGILAGDAATIADLCLQVTMTARSTGYQVADQSGFNVLLNSVPYKAVTQFVNSEDGFTCQSGTFADPSKIAMFRPNLLEPEPKLDEEGVKTAGGKLYPIVHQYDRIPEWNAFLRKTLNEKLK